MMFPARSAKPAVVARLLLPLFLATVAAGAAKEEVKVEESSSSPREHRFLPRSCQDKIKPERSLVITSTAIVNNPRTLVHGPWAFSTVLQRATAHHPQTGNIAYRWLDQYRSLRSFNGYPVPIRNPYPLLREWPLVPAQRPTLDLNTTPFRLLAIIFRPDLEEKGTFGEGRFIYAAYDSQRNPLDFTLIFEFALQPTPNLPSKASWLRSLVRLSRLDEKSFAGALQVLTDQFTYPFAGRSQLLRMRTNEQIFGQGWDMREFHFAPHQQTFIPQALPKTPDLSLSGSDSYDSSRLAQWILDHADAINKNDYTLPEEFTTASGLLIDDRFRWFKDHPSIPPKLAHQFSRQTCNGCHGATTGTSFLHVVPRHLHAEAKLSSFLHQEIITRKQYLERQVCAHISTPTSF